MNHILDAYKDGFQWIVFCRDCGQENPEGKPCVPLKEIKMEGSKWINKPTFKSGLPDRI